MLLKKFFNGIELVTQNRFTVLVIEFLVPDLIQKVTDVKENSTLIPKVAPHIKSALEYFNQSFFNKLYNFIPEVTRKQNKVYLMGKRNPFVKIELKWEVGQNDLDTREMKESLFVTISLALLKYLSSERFNEVKKLWLSYDWH